MSDLGWHRRPRQACRVSSPRLNFAGALTWYPAAVRPNRRIRALKTRALLSGSESGRGFGSVFHHHLPKTQPLSVGIFFDFSQWRQPLTCVAWRALGTENPGVLPKKAADISVFSPLASRAFSRSLPYKSTTYECPVGAGRCSPLGVTKNHRRP